jgi:hypothetical protein
VGRTWHRGLLFQSEDCGQVIYGAENYRYERPVVVPMNYQCFSATEIFMAGLWGVRDVTLLGTPSSGGSAATQTIAADPKHCS